MKFTFKSEQYGTVVEMSFEGVTLSEIKEMYKQFLRGSGFYLVEDEDNVSTKEQNADTSEECVHEVDMSYRPGGLTVEQAEKQKPVVEVQYFGEKQIFVVLKQLSDGDKLYTAPPKREWVGLTDEEVHEAAIKCVKSGQSVNAAIRAIEAKLKKLNK